MTAIDIAGAVVLVDRGACFLIDEGSRRRPNSGRPLVIANRRDEKAFSERQQ